MNNGQLESSIKANQIAISALKKEQSNIFNTIEKNRAKIENKFVSLVYGYDEHAPFIPEKMKSSIVFHIASELIRPKWNDYSREGYTNSLDIYYKGPKSYDTKEGEYRWEFSHSSGRFYVCSNDEQYQKLDNEYMDAMKLSLGMYHFVNSCKEKIAAIHEEYRANESLHYDITEAIKKLERSVETDTVAIERNNIIRNFKPGGETAIWLMNKEIALPTSTYWHFSRRNSTCFEAIELIKETKKGIRANFIRIYKNGEEMSRYVTETKVVDLDTLVNIWKYSVKALKDLEAREARNAEREARLKESQVNA